MVRFALRGFRRFEDAELDVDAPVVALVGPNESGKTSLLDALVYLGGFGNRVFNDRDRTRGATVTGRVLEALYRLDDDDRAAITAKAARAPEVRWFRVWRDADGTQSYDTSPPLASMEQTDHQPAKAGTAQKDTTRAVVGIAEVVQAPVSEVVLSVLKERIPLVLKFSETDRILRSEYDLTQPGAWTGGIRNLARLAGFDLNELARHAAGSQPELYEDITERANARLTNAFSPRWSQAPVTVHLRVTPPKLRVFVKEAEEGSLYRLEDRSAGLCAFVALVAFLAAKNTKVRPVLVVDEAEHHLHWDAQADLIKLFHTQEVASQVIYSTHSPGCLPHDLGQGVRAVASDPARPDRSTVKNRIWKDEGGFRPLLLDMGASTAAVTPHRFAVVTEGVADFILLPSLLREATGHDSLPYQIVPGLAQLSRSGIQRINSEADRVVYLTDGDEGGEQLRKDVKSADLPDGRTFSLPAGTALEDLVAGDTLAAAVNEELSRSGHQTNKPLELPDSGRVAYLKKWYRCNGLDPDKHFRKRAIASHALEIAAGNPPEPGPPLLEEHHRTALAELHEKLLGALCVSQGRSQDSEAEPDFSPAEGPSVAGVP